jgi:hypothetical protein
MELFLVIGCSAVFVAMAIALMLYGKANATRHDDQ